MAGRVAAAVQATFRTFRAACISAVDYATAMTNYITGKDIQSMMQTQASEQAFAHTQSEEAVAVGVEVVACTGPCTTRPVHHVLDLSHAHISSFECALAAGMGLLDACVATQVLGGSSVLKNLRLVSKASSTLALRAITGYSAPWEGACWICW